MRSGFEQHKNGTKQLNTAETGSAPTEPDNGLGKAKVSGITSVELTQCENVQRKRQACYLSELLLQMGFPLT